MKSYTGINIQFPISQLILDGSKIIETRTYPIPKQYLGKELAIIETPGKTGRFKSRIIGTIVFSTCFQYKDKIEFYADFKNHKIAPDSPWKWHQEKPKWGWKVEIVRQLSTPIEAPKKKGIVYTKGIYLK